MAKLEGAPDSVMRGFARMAAVAIGGWFVQHGIASEIAGTPEFTTMLTEVLGGAVAVVIGLLFDVMHKYRITDYIVTANQADAMHPATPAATVVAVVGAEVAAKKAATTAAPTNPELMG